MITLERTSASVCVDLRRGGRIGSLRVDGREFLVGPPDPEDSSFRWGCFIMAPWVGRIERGVLQWDGMRHRLPLTDGHHALHGLVFDRPWEVEQATEAEIVLSCRIGPPDWPARGLVRQGLILGDGHLDAWAEVAASEPMPASVGWHPWFARDHAERIQLAAAETLEMRSLIPTGRRIPVDTLTDLRDGPRLGDRALDHAYPDAASPALVTWRTGSLLIEWASPVSAVVAHSTRRAFCIEPQTAWPNAPALHARGIHGTGLVILKAGARLRAHMRWRWRFDEASSTPLRGDSLRRKTRNGRQC